MAENKLELGTKTIKDLKAEVAALKKELDGCAVGSEQAAKKSQELSNAQSQLNAALKGAIDKAGQLDNSYNGLVTLMAKLKAEWKATNDEAKRAELGKQIGSLNDQLKKMDADVGVFSRNVGNYQSAFEALGGQGASSIVSGLNGMKGAMTALGVSAGWVTAILFAFQLLVEAFKRNTDAMDGLNNAMIPFKALWIQIQRTFDDIVKTFVDLQKNAGTLGEVLQVMQKVGLIPLNTLIAAIRLNFTMMANGFKVWENILNEILTPLKKVITSFNEMTGVTKVFDKVKSAFVDMLDSLTSAWNWLAKSKFGEIMNLEEVADSIKDIIFANSEVVETNQEILDIEKKLRKAKESNARLAGDEAVELAKLRDTYNQLAADDEKRLALGKQISDIEQSQKQRAYDMAVLEYELVQKRNSLTTSSADDILEEANAYKTMQEALAALNTKSTEYYKEARKNAKDTTEVVETSNEDQEEAEKKRLEEIKRLEESLNKWKSSQSEGGKLKALQDQYDAELLLLKDNDNAKLLLTEKYERDKADIEKYYRDLADAEKAAKDAKEKEELLQKIDERYEILAQTVDVVAMYSASLDGTFSEVGNLITTLMDATLNLSKSIDEGKKGWQLYAQVASVALNGVGAMLNNIAAQQEETSEDGFELKKKYEIASATMTMLGGIVGSLAGIPSYIDMFKVMGIAAPAAGIALGSSLAAMVGAMGAVNIALISKQKFGGTSSPSAPGISGSALSSIAAPVQYTSEVQGASAETEINNLKVYVVESDITNTQNKVSIAESEATF